MNFHVFINLTLLQGRLAQLFCSVKWKVNLGKNKDMLEIKVSPKNNLNIGLLTVFHRSCIHLNHWIQVQSQD